MDFLAVPTRRLPDVLYLERPIFPREADIVRPGSDPRAARHPFVNNWLRRGQIGGLDLVVLRAANRSRIYFSAIHGDDKGVRRIISFHASVAFLDTPDESARQFILGVSRKHVTDNCAADSSERKALDVSVLAEFAADRMLGRPRLHLRIAHGHRRYALRRVHISFQQQRRRFEGGRDVVESEFRAVGRQQVGHINVDGQQVTDSVRIFGPIQTVHDEAARGALGFPGSIERGGEPARKARVFGLGRPGHTLRRHRPHAQLSKDSLKCARMAQQIVEGRRLQIDRIVGRQRRSFVVTRHTIFIRERAVLDGVR